MNYVCAFSSSNRTKLLFSAVLDLGFPAISSKSHPQNPKNPKNFLSDFQKNKKFFE